MRWFWIDRFIEFDSGKSAKAVKNVSLSEEHLHDHFPGFPVMPGSLMLEGMAQTGGVLLGEAYGFKHVVVLAKVPKVSFYARVVPGDQIIYAATLLDARDEGGVVSVRATCGDRLVAEAEIVYAHVKPEDAGVGSDQQSCVFNSGLAAILEIGKAGDR